MLKRFLSYLRYMGLILLSIACSKKIVFTPQKQGKATEVSRDRIRKVINPNFGPKPIVVSPNGSKKSRFIQRDPKEEQTFESATDLKISQNLSKNIKKQGDTPLSAQNYIDMFSPVAVQEMIQYKIPASITLAQGILESGIGKSRLAKDANNHFGIKCHGWLGPKVYHDDDEKRECFRKYQNPMSSYRDHSLFLKGRSFYTALFDLNIYDYKGWAKGLKKAGYATAPDYAERLIKLIEKYELYQYDKQYKVAKNDKRQMQSPQKTTLDKQPTKTAIYVVAQKDTLYSISKKFNTTIEEIKQLNSLASNTLSIGQFLKVPKQ